jgi:hypothetical protein
MQSLTVERGVNFPLRTTIFLLNIAATDMVIFQDTVIVAHNYGRSEINYMGLKSQG